MRFKSTVLIGMIFALGLSGIADPAAGQEVHGFVEGLAGARTAEGQGLTAGEYTAQEARFQLRLSGYGDDAEYFARIDFLSDPVEDGRDGLEIREAYLTYTGLGRLDFKVGRQALTWGTGDLLFINDVFAKDWESFFIGREDQYLKAPHDALRLGIYPSFVDLDLVLIPTFQPDRLPMPPRLGVYDPFGGLPRTVQMPKKKLGNGEIAARASRTVGGWDLALYGYWGRSRQPLGVSRVDSTEVVLFHPRVDTYGASVRGNLLGGVVNLEGAYLYSLDDKSGADPLVENSWVRWMFGYDRQLASDTQLGLQGYYELMVDYDCYKSRLPQGQPLRDELRQIYTLRLTQMFQYQTLIFSLFTFWSPTDEDYYLRFSVDKKLTDALNVVVGTNVFGGNEEWTLFGSQEYNDNVYLRARYSF